MQECVPPDTVSIRPSPLSTVEETALRVLHVLPTDVARGAQVFARAFVDRANLDPADEHEIVVLFASTPVAAFADRQLGVPSGRLHSAGFDPRAAWRLWRLVRVLRPDVVVAHGAESMKYAVVCRTRRRRIVCHAIGVVSPKAMQGGSRALQGALLGRADLVVAVSNAVARQLGDLFSVDPDRLRVIPNGRDPGRFTAASTRAVGAVPRLAFVGHLTATKRPDLFIDVVALLRQRGCPLTAAIVGDGPLASSLARPAAAAGVDLVGRLADVGSFLASSDVFVFPSLAEGEGMPGVLIEAGLAALPVVATDVPGVRDVVSDRVTGRVVGVDDVAALTDATEELVRNPPLRAAMGASARDRCQRLFSLDVCAGRWVEELRALVGAPGT